MRTCPRDLAASSRNACLICGQRFTVVDVRGREGSLREFGEMKAGMLQKIKSYII